VLLAQIAQLQRKEPGAKVLIFTQFAGTIAQLKRELAAANVEFQTLTGRYPALFAGRVRGDALQLGFNKYT
jgi:hypothetical protein